jgi:hypothetical protein
MDFAIYTEACRILSELRDELTENFAIVPDERAEP